MNLQDAIQVLTTVCQSKDAPFISVTLKIEGTDVNKQVSATVALAYLIQNELIQIVGNKNVIQIESKAFEFAVAMNALYSEFDNSNVEYTEDEKEQMQSEAFYAQQIGSNYKPFHHN